MGKLKLFCQHRGLALVFGLTIGICLEVPSHAATAPDCNDSSGVCVSGGQWAPDTEATAKQRSKRRLKAAKVSMTVVNGRGSLFANGRYVGSSPFEGVTIAAGRNDIEIRDGDQVIARGMLSIADGKTATLTVRRP